jgi:predicted glycosyltransferase
VKEIMSNILIDVGHPAHVHLFRNAARDWSSAGNTVLFTALDREIILELLDIYKLPYQVTYKRRKGKLALLLELVVRTLSTYRIAREFRADLFVSFGNPTVGLPARLMGKPYIALTDTEHAIEQHALFKPLATVIPTPDVFTLNMGPKQVRYAGFHELMYLHPDEFTPDPRQLDSLDLKPEDRFFVVRFVSWEATHDIGETGFSANDKETLLRELSARGRVLLSVESGDIDPEFRPLVTTFAPEKAHHLLAFASLYIGEGGTMLTEAALLGTPAIFVSTLRAGNWEHLRDKYDLLYFYDTGSEGLAKAIELLEMPYLKTVWAERRRKMLLDKIDPTPWLVKLGNSLMNKNSMSK